MISKFKTGDTVKYYSETPVIMQMPAIKDATYVVETVLYPGDETIDGSINDTKEIIYIVRSTKSNKKYTFIETELQTI